MQLPSEFKRRQILSVEGVEENETDSRALAMSRTDCGKLVQAEAAFTPPELVVQPLVILTKGVWMTGKAVGRLEIMGEGGASATIAFTAAPCQRIRFFGYALALPGGGGPECRSGRFAIGSGDLCSSQESRRSPSGIIQPSILKRSLARGRLSAAHAHNPAVHRPRAGLGLNARARQAAQFSIWLQELVGRCNVRQMTRSTRVC